MKGFLGIDIGAVSTNVVILDSEEKILAKVYTLTEGRPVGAVQRALREALKQLGSRNLKNLKIEGVGTTGSAREIIGVMVGADIVETEIIAHAIAAVYVNPEVRTILEIGGQDSKIILVRGGIVEDFAMNPVCAAGTGAFLEHQANRLQIPIEEFGPIACRAKEGIPIASRCTVFAESDMIHKQAEGASLEGILYGLCQALVRNYLNTLAKGKEILEPVFFQGGVAANAGMRQAFKENFKREYGNNFQLIIPEHFDVMGALGMALLVKANYEEYRVPSNFVGFGCTKIKFKTSSFSCGLCPNNCFIKKLSADGKVSYLGNRCEKGSSRDSEKVQASY